MLIAGQQALAEDLPREQRVDYSCHGPSGHRAITALLFNQPPAEVILLKENGQAGAVRLLQQPAASGARYSDGDQTFWIKGDTATYTRGGTDQCQVDRTVR